MSSGRRIVRLRDVAELDIDRVPVLANDTYSMVGVLNAGRGLFWRDTISGSDTTYQALHRLRAGQLVYRKLTAWEGPITTVPEEFDGAFVSGEFPTFTIDAAVLEPGYMTLLCQRPSFWDDIRVHSTGTAERRSRLKPRDLLDLAVELPPLHEQRRIIEALAVIDRSVEARRLEHAALVQTLALLREEWLAVSGHPTVTVADLVRRIVAGKSPKCHDREPTEDEWGVLKVSAIRPGLFNPREAKALPSDVEPFKGAEVRQGDVLVSRANTLALVGSACRVTQKTDQLLLCDKTLRLELKTELIDPDYFVEAVSASPSREQIEAFAAGSSDSMKNISQAGLRTVEIPVPTFDEQRAVAQQLGALRESATAVAAEARELLQLRTALLEDLASGDRAAPAVQSASAEQELVPDVA